MLPRLFRNTNRYGRSYARLLFTLVALLLILDTCDLILFSRLPQRVQTSAKPSNHGRIFIASIHWFNERILRSHWNNAVVDLVKHLGPANVFVAMLGSQSLDNTIGALQELDEQLAQLGVARSVVLENRTHEDEISRIPSPGEEGWIWTPRGKKELRRIPYLASLRNRVMLEMDNKATEAGFERFDKVLWLNDVVFTVWYPLTMPRHSSLVSHVRLFGMLRSVLYTLGNVYFCCPDCYAVLLSCVGNYNW